MDPNTRLPEEAAEQIFYSMNLKQLGEQNFLRFHIGTDEICTFFTSQVKRDDVPVIFNVILDQDEPREKYFGFIKKWTNYIYEKMQTGAAFTINPIIIDIERRQAIVDFNHARFQVLAKRDTWIELYEATKAPIPINNNTEQLCHFGFISDSGKIKRAQFLNLVDFSINNDFLHISGELEQHLRSALAEKILRKIDSIHEFYGEAKNFQQLHFLSPDFPHFFFSLLEDAIPYKIFTYLQMRSLASAEQIANAIQVELDQVRDYIEFLGNHSLAFVSLIDGEDSYIYRLLELKFSIPYKESPKKIEMVRRNLPRSADFTKIGSSKAASSNKEKSKIRTQRKKHLEQLKPTIAPVPNQLSPPVKATEKQPISKQGTSESTKIEKQTVSKPLPIKPQKDQKQVPTKPVKLANKIPEQKRGSSIQTSQEKLDIEVTGSDITMEEFIAIGKVFQNLVSK